MNTQNNDRPVKEFRSHNLKVAIWENRIEQDGQTLVNRSLTFQKRYKDRQSGEWRDSGSLFPEEALRLARLFERAYDWIEVRETEPAAASS